MATALLACGTVLDYESSNHLPAVGDSVPCRHHGYCPVSERTGGAGHRRRRAQRRSCAELLAWLQVHPYTTLASLRRQRFTLRLVHEAAMDGLVEVDMDRCTVAARHHPPERC